MYFNIELPLKEKKKKRKKKGIPDFIVIIEKYWKSGFGIGRHIISCAIKNLICSLGGKQIKILFSVIGPWRRKWRFFNVSGKMNVVVHSVCARHLSDVLENPSDCHVSVKLTGFGRKRERLSESSQNIVKARYRIKAKFQ